MSAKIRSPRRQRQKSSGAVQPGTKVPAQASARAPINVIVVADVRLYRDCLESTLKHHNGLSIIATAGNETDARASVQARQPDVIIIDVSMPGAFELTSELHTQMPQVRVVAMAVKDDFSAILACAHAGADGFVTVNASLDDLVDAVERVLAGELLCTPRIAAELFHGIGGRTGQPHSTLSGTSLTVREQQVLSYVSHGLSNKEIAASLNISEATVKSHVHHLLEKLHVSSRAQAIARAMLPESPIPRVDHGAR